MGDTTTTLPPALASFRRAKGQYKLEAEVVDENIVAVASQQDLTATSTEEDPEASELASDDVEATPESENPDTSLEKVEDSDESEAKPKPTRQSWKNRHGELRTFHNDFKEEKEAELDNLKTQLREAKQEVDLSKLKSEEELEVFREKYPEVFDNMMSIAKREAIVASKELADEFKSLDTMKADLLKEQSMVELRKLHSDAEEIKDSDEFKEWYELQSVGVQNLIKSTNVKDVSTGLSLYKKDADIKPIEDKVKQDKLDASKSVSTKSGTDDIPVEPKRWKESEAVAALKLDYDKFIGEIEQARKDGLFDYGV